MSPSWPASALEAQAIAARTFVLKKKLSTPRHATYDVEASVLHQAYKGSKSLDPRTRAAADKTRGVVLTWEGELADAFYFSACRKTTESAAAAFGTAQPYLVPTACTGGEAAPKASWTVRLDREAVSLLLKGQGLISGELEQLEVASRTKTGRMSALRLVTSSGTRSLPATDFRRIVGYSELPSLDAEVQQKGGTFVFTGGGYGHGVGLCQWCARGQAAAGRSAEKILAHAYPGTALKRVY
jgi:stage II sporulation protein D